MMLQVGGIDSDTDFLDLVFGELTGGMGEALFGLLIAAFVFLMLYYASDGRFGVPAIVVTLSGAWLVSVIPPQFRGMAEAVIIVGLTGGVFAIAKRYFLRPTA